MAPNQFVRSKSNRNVRKYQEIASAEYFFLLTLKKIVKKDEEKRKTVHILRICCPSKKAKSHKVSRGEPAKTCYLFVACRR